MPVIFTHAAMVQPIPRLTLECKIVFDGEINTVIDEETLTGGVEECEVIGLVEECEIVTTLEDCEVVAVVEEDSV